MKVGIIGDSSPCGFGMAPGGTPNGSGIDHGAEKPENLAAVAPQEFCGRSSERRLQF
jgi:hypothetical protein